MLHRTLPRALSLAFVLAAASLGPLFFAGTAFAAAPKDAAAVPDAAKADAAAEAKSAKPPAKAKSKPKKAAPSKAHAPAKAHAKRVKTASKPAKGKTKRNASREHKPAAKRSKPAPKVDSDSPRTGRAGSPAPCVGPVVALDRAGSEAERLALVDCHGAPLRAALIKVAVLARPSGATRESLTASSRVDPGLVARVDALARKFPGRALSIVAAPAPSGGGSSAHQSGRAVDLRVEGVEARKVVEACRTLPDTGCGFYPNAAFVHLDVRASGAGKSSWIDASEPGDPPRYVSSWPRAAASSKPDSATR